MKKFLLFSRTDEDTFIEPGKESSPKAEIKNETVTLAIGQVHTELPVAVQ
jgi:hypothetical protein